MNARVQPALDGSVPEPAKTRTQRRVDDYETWVELVRPVFLRVAAAGKPFTSWDVADEHDLPEPPNSRSHWGNFISLLREDGLITHYGWTNSHRPGDNKSGVKVWCGTRLARRMQRDLDRAQQQEAAA